MKNLRNGVSISYDEVPKVTANSITNQLSCLPPAGVISPSADREYILSLTSSTGSWVLDS